MPVCYVMTSSPVAVVYSGGVYVALNICNISVDLNLFRCDKNYFYVHYYHVFVIASTNWEFECVYDARNMANIVDHACK